jgi:hypothetical protein
LCTGCFGDEEAAVEAHDRAVTNTLRFNNLMYGGDRMKEENLHHAGILMSVLKPNIPGYDVDFAPWRTAEYAAMDQDVLAAVLLVMNVAAVLLATAVVVVLWRRRRQGNAPVLIWIGWKRLVTIQTVAVLLPVAAFGLWTAVSPVSSRRFGSNVAMDPLFLEYSLLAAVIAGLLVSLGVRAIRNRALQIGMSVPPSGRTGPRCAFLVLGLTVLGTVGWYLATWSPGTARIEVVYATHLNVLLFLLLWLGSQFCLLKGCNRWLALSWGLICPGLAMMVAALIGYAAALVFYPNDAKGLGVVCGCVGIMIGSWWGLARLLLTRSHSALFEWSALRSLVPIITVAAVFLAVVAGPALFWMEASAVNRIGEPASAVFVNEAERSDLRILRDGIVRGQ